MKIVACVKQVPDSDAKVTVENGNVTWHEASLIMNPWDEYAVEAALVQKDLHDAEVTALSIGFPSVVDVLKHALAMGCPEAVLVSTSAKDSIDHHFTARVLAAAIQKIGGVDMVFMGRQAIDTDMSTTAIQVARLLGWSVLTLVSAIPLLDPVSNIIQVERVIEEGRQITESHLPVVVSVVKDIGEPRYPSFRNIRKAQSIDIPIWTLTDLGLTSYEPSVIMIDLINSPKKQTATEILSGSNPKEIAEKLVGKILNEGITL